MLFEEYLLIRTGGNTCSAALSNIEKKCFGIGDTKKGWPERYKHLELPNEIILKAIKLLLNNENSNIKDSVLKRLKDLTYKLELPDPNFDYKGFERVYLYIMKNEIGMYKVGISKNPKERRANLSNSSGLKIKLVSTYSGREDALGVEQNIFKQLKTHLKIGEWFKAGSVTIQDIEALLPESYRKH